MASPFFGGMFSGGAPLGGGLSGLPPALQMAMMGASPGLGGGGNSGAGGGTGGPQISMLPNAARSSGAPGPAMPPAPQPPQNNMMSMMNGAGSLANIGKDLGVGGSGNASTGILGSNGPLFGETGTFGSSGPLFGDFGAFGSGSLPVPAGGYGAMPSAADSMAGLDFMSPAMTAAGGGVGAYGPGTAAGLSGLFSPAAGYMGTGTAAGLAGLDTAGYMGTGAALAGAGAAGAGAGAATGGDALAALIGFAAM